MNTKTYVTPFKVANSKPLKMAVKDLLTVTVGFIACTAHPQTALVFKRQSVLLNTQNYDAWEVNSCASCMNVCEMSKI